MYWENGKALVLFIGRILDDDDSEYDSEMDDFIDDGPEGQEDYSKYISEIFGYDKSRYRQDNYEDDDIAMESSFSQMMKEESISGKIGKNRFEIFHNSLLYNCSSVRQTNRVINFNSTLLFLVN